MKDHVRARVAAAIVSWKAYLPHSHYFACETRLTWSELSVAGTRVSRQCGPCWPAGGRRTPAVRPRWRGAVTSRTADTAHLPGTGRSLAGATARPTSQ